MYWHVIISVIVWFPLGVMVICYTAIFLKLDRYEQKVLRRENPISVSYKTKVARMMFTVLIVFVLLRVPFTALIFVRNQMLKDTKVNQVQGAFSILWYCSHYLMFCNAAINPIIYGLTNDNFRKAYRQTPLIKLFCKSTQPAGLKPRATPRRSQAVDQERQQRIVNMLLDEGATEVRTKEVDVNTLEEQKNSPDQTVSSTIWHTKMLEGTKSSETTRNLDDDGESDATDFDATGISNSQVETEVIDDDSLEERERKGISGNDFI